MNLIAGIDVTAGALNAYKTRLDVVAQNIANAQTTRTPGGGAYQRQVVSFETELVRRVAGSGPSLQSVKIGSISADRTPGSRSTTRSIPTPRPTGWSRCRTSTCPTKWST